MRRAHKGRSHNAKRKLHHEEVVEGVVVVGHGVTVGVDHLSNGMGGSGGCFKKEFFESCVKGGRDNDGCIGLVGTWRG